MKDARREGIGGRLTSGGVYSLSGMVAGLLVVAGCSDSSGSPQPLTDAVVDGGADNKDMGGADGGSFTCRPSPLASENLDPRVDVTAPAMQGRQVVKTSDLFTRFNSICGSCHVAAVNGGFQVTATTFPTVFDYSRLARIMSDDPSFAMPPVGKAFSSRGPDDPVRLLAGLLKIWLDQGRPVDMFVADGSSVPSGAAAASYSYSVMTNLGNCVPPPTMYASSSSMEMTAKDTFFANATSLPDDLADTDLTTFDTAALAANGMIAYRPTYPLWSDGSGKLRFIRVPKGTSIKFDKDKQTFDIPTNTRFYKTFFREVIDKAGHVSHKKMETRLIVTKPDTVDTDGVTPLPQALYGTYLWSDDEMTATLWKNPNRDGTGFSDLTEEYATNEIAYQDVIDNLAPGAASLAVKLQNELDDPKHFGLIQHYAVPGSIRCVQCHRGSPTKDFVLGFYPLQVAQRAASTGGTYEPVDADELNQLQRFIDYGLITGMASPADVVPLESSQAPRKARTTGELNAQAYMIGNCAHCHNPRGYPSLAKPELTTALNFLPGSTTDAGIFEFDFERMSPVRSRGANQNVPIPYITPSLRDYPVADDSLVRVDNGVQLREPGDPNSAGGSEVTWSPKYDYEVEGPGGLGCASPSRGPNLEAFCRGRTVGHTFVPAPWRSLIYRNVDTPFPYFDDYVPFPHMPMNTAGFDCRAPRLMGEWMVGLPAVLKPKYRGLVENTIPYARNPNGTYPPYYIDAPQPYQEVKPDDDGYPDAQAAANDRLTEYRNGIRYQYCEDTLSPDILDPIRSTAEQPGGPRANNTFYPVVNRYLFGGVPPFDPSRPGQYVQPPLGVPFHAEWFNYDPTDQSPWQPRRADWKPMIIDGIPDTVPLLGVLPDPNADVNSAARTLADSRRQLADALQKAKLTDDLRRYATTEVPYGLWQTKTGCETKLAATNIKKLSDPAFAGANRPAWMDQVHASSDAPVYMMSPGAALYRHICINCHGPRADGKGLQSDALAASSEGQTRPANLSGGFFGPSNNLGANLLATFGQGTGDRSIADNTASHYMAWMTLGGTLQLIPQDVINQVQATKILGAARQNLSSLGTAALVSANMLNIAKGLCAAILPDVTNPDLYAFVPSDDYFNSNLPPLGSYLKWNDSGTPFIRTNGDLEMWVNLCSVHNRQLVRVYVAENVTDGSEKISQVRAPLRAIYYADDGNSPPAYQYPPTDPNGPYGVWDHNQHVRHDGVTPDNYYPACLSPGPIGSSGTAVDPALLAALEARSKLPLCDPGFLQHQELIMWNAQDAENASRSAAETDAMREWSVHGAINAAMSVFSYLETADLAHNQLPPYYDQCERLP